MPHQSQKAVLGLLDTDRYYLLSEEEKPHGPTEVLNRFMARGFIKDDMEGGYDITNLGAIFLRGIYEILHSGGKISPRGQVHGPRQTRLRFGTRGSERLCHWVFWPAFIRERSTS